MTIIDNNLIPHFHLRSLSDWDTHGFDNQPHIEIAPSVLNMPEMAIDHMMWWFSAFHYSTF